MGVILAKKALRKIGHNSHVFGGKKRHKTDDWKTGKTVENKGFCVSLRAVLADKLGDPRGVSKMLYLPVFTFRTFEGQRIVMFGR